VQLRDCDPHRDAQACAEIYAPYVLETAISFEERPPSAREMGDRIDAAYVWLVAEAGDRPIGYAYGSRHQKRAAYRWAADVAVYIDREHHRAGVGGALYAQLFERLREAGLWTLCAGVTQPNRASDGLHAAMGFESVGVYRRIGWKLGAWHDVRWWQLDLRPDETGPPAPDRPTRD
jgi:L-amino acid N-acyltransferase YncA